MSVADKYAKLGHPMVSGSTTGQSYLKVAEDSARGAVLGIKLALEGRTVAGVPCVQLGLRVRLMPVDHPIGRADNPSQWVTAFPKFKWSEMSMKRYALTVAVVLRRGPHDAWMVPYDVEKLGIASGLTGWITTRLTDATWLADPEVVCAFVTDSVRMAITHKPPPAALDPVVGLAATKDQISELKKRVKTLQEQIASGVVDPSVFVTDVDHMVLSPLHTAALKKALAVGMTSGSASPEADAGDDDPFED